VAEAARNVACTGARPMAITNCLNFGNPTRPEVFYQFKEAVAGMGEACRALGTPVTGGNVSLYNESPSGAVYPTPVIGMVGLIDDLSHITRATFQHDGDAVLLLGEMRGELGGSEYLATIHGEVLGAPPRCDLDLEKKVIDSLLEAIRAGAVSSAHDCSDGGLAIALAECCVANLEVPEWCGDRPVGIRKHSKSRGSVRGDAGPHCDFQLRAGARSGNCRESRGSLRTNRHGAAQL